MMNRKGLIAIPFTALILLFTVLIFLLIDQKQNSNAIMLEYRASRTINLLIDLYFQEDMPSPDEIDSDIIGFGLYGIDGKLLYHYGTAPQDFTDLNRHADVYLKDYLPAPQLRNIDLQGGRVLFNGNESIAVIRPLIGDQTNMPMGSMMQQMPPAITERAREFRRQGGGMPQMGMNSQFRTAGAGVYLEYRNGAYLKQRNLNIAIVSLSLAVFAVSVLLIISLYLKNRKLELKSEKDRQLIQLGEAARVLAHEIRNPLGVLKIQRDLLVKKLGEGYSGNLDVIDRELKRLNTLVEKVGDFLRNPAGTGADIDVGSYLNGLYGDRDSINLNGINPGECFISFDPERLRTVFDNVINNAVESGGTAELDIFSSADSVAVEIKDYGRGFSSDNLSMVFEPFFTTKTSGMGLGLSVVKKFMEASGGRVMIGNHEAGGYVRLEFRRGHGPGSTG